MFVELNNNLFIFGAFQIHIFKWVILYFLNLYWKTLGQKNFTGWTVSYLVPLQGACGPRSIMNFNRPYSNYMCLDRASVNIYTRWTIRMYLIKPVFENKSCYWKWWFGLLDNLFGIHISLGSAGSVRFRNETRRLKII